MNILTMLDEARDKQDDEQAKTGSSEPYYAIAHKQAIEWANKLDESTFIALIVAAIREHKCGEQHIRSMLINDAEILHAILDAYNANAYKRWHRIDSDTYSFGDDKIVLHGSHWYVLGRAGKFDSLSSAIEGWLCLS